MASSIVWNAIVVSPVIPSATEAESVMHGRRRGEWPPVVKGQLTPVKISLQAVDTEGVEIG
jgi:hypothetical protein